MCSCRSSDVGCFRTGIRGTPATPDQRLDHSLATSTVPPSHRPRPSPACGSGPPWRWRLWEVRQTTCHVSSDVNLPAITILSRAWSTRKTRRFFQSVYYREVGRRAGRLEGSLSRNPPTEILFNFKFESSNDSQTLISPSPLASPISCHEIIIKGAWA